MATAATASSAAIIEVTWLGTVSDGWDYAGVFGPSHADLTGCSYTACFVFDTGVASAHVGTSPNENDLWGGEGSGDGSMSPSLGATISINGRTITFGGSHRGQILAGNWPNGARRYYNFSAGTDNEIYHNITSHKLMNMPAAIDVDFYYLVDPATDMSYGYFYSNTAEGCVSGSLSVSSVNVAVVPGPMSGAGLPGISASFSAESRTSAPSRSLAPQGTCPRLPG
jgi:hypothetical protein